MIPKKRPEHIRVVDINLEYPDADIHRSSIVSIAQRFRGRIYRVRQKDTDQQRIYFMFPNYDAAEYFHRAIMKVYPKNYLEDTDESYGFESTVPLVLRLGKPTDY